MNRNYYILVSRNGFIKLLVCANDLSEFINIASVLKNTFPFSGITLFVDSRFACICIFFYDSPRIIFIKNIEVSHCIDSYG